MAPRSGHRRVDHGSPLVDLDDVFADDRLVDAMAQPAIGQPIDAYPVIAAGTAGAGPAARDGRRRRLGVATGDPLIEVLRSWRDELAAVPLPAPPDVHRADSTVLPESVSAGKRSLRPALAVAAAIAALLVGSATVGSRHASPDGALWAVTEVLWPDHAESVTSRHNVQDALHQAQAALANGRTQQAQLALLRAAVELGKVDDVDGRVDMQAQVDQLWRQAAPQDLSSTSLAPELLAGGLEAAVASAVSTPSRDPGAGALSSKPPSASSPISVSKVNQGPSSPAAVPTQPLVGSSTSVGLPEPNAGPALSMADPVVPPAVGQGAVPPPSASVVAPSTPLDSAAVVTGPPSGGSAPVLPTMAPAVSPASDPPAAVDPGSAPALTPPPPASALTPPPPAAADRASASASTDPAPSAAPPAPAPTPTSTDAAPDQTDPGTNGATVGAATGMQSSANTPTGDTVLDQTAAADAGTAAGPPIG